MNYAVIKKTDIANGPGIRVSLFVSGCTHGCKGCFNREAWDFSYGEPFTEETIHEILDALAPEYISGLSILGGEPLEPQNRCGVCAMMEAAKKKYPEKSIWCYTGYGFKRDLQTWAREGDKDINTILSLADVIVDGPFVEAQKNLNLVFCGSENQQLVDVQKTLKAGHLVLWDREQSQ